MGTLAEAGQMLTTQFYVLFDSRLGACAIAWQGDAITQIRLPDASPAETEAVLEGLPSRRHQRGQPPPFVRDAVARLRKHLAGRPQDLSSLPLALDRLPLARQKIYAAARTVVAGETVTYEELARKAGLPGAARAAGAAMAANPFLLAVPCHRVLGAGGALHGFSAFGGVLTKRALLKLEGVVTSVPRSPLPRRRPDGLEYDWGAALRSLRRQDPPLTKLIGRLRGQRMEIGAMQDPFESLFRAIVYQQLSGKAASTILGRVQALFGGGRFPSPDELLAADPVRLRGAGLSGSKEKALRDLASKALAGVVPSLAQLHRLRDEEIIERLTSVWGVGKWSVEMMLMFRLGRPDVLPVDDLGVRKGFGICFGLGRPGTAAELTAHAERWRPYRAVGSWLMWRAVDMKDGWRLPPKWVTRRAAEPTRFSLPQGRGRLAAHA